MRLVKGFDSARDDEMGCHCATVPLFPAALRGAPKQASFGAGGFLVSDPWNRLQG
jgi:hypothetical protein